MLLDSSCDSSHEEGAAAEELRRMWCVLKEWFSLGVLRCLERVSGGGAWS
jgi:hypothetical protein